MQEIKDEDRIIAKILRGELKIDNLYVEHLEYANLSREQEQTFLKLADEIKQVAEQNEEIRTEVKEKIEKSEKNAMTKLDLIVIEEEIRKTTKKINSLEENRVKLLHGGLRGTIGLTILAGITFLFSFVYGTLITVGVAMLGSIITSFIVEKCQKNIEVIKGKIQKLENSRLEILGYDNKNMFASTAQKTKNITRKIYNSKDLTMTDEEMASIS